VFGYWGNQRLIVCSEFSKMIDWLLNWTTSVFFPYGPRQFVKSSHSDPSLKWVGFILFHSRTPISNQHYNYTFNWWFTKCKICIL